MWHKGAIAFRIYLLAASLALSQSPTGDIAGVVRDATGAVVPNAEIQVVNQNTGERKAAVTNSSGEFVVPLLPVGVYTVSTSMAGFRTAERHEVALSALQNLRVDFSLEVGEATQTVTVTAETPQVDTRSAIHGMLVDDRRVRDLPLNGRNALDLVRLIPGVNSVGTTIRPSFGQQTMRLNGGRQTGVNYLLDGGSVGYFHRGQGLGLPPPDALQEFKVATVGTPAEYGRGAAVISAVTRSGTNEFHGSAWEFLRNDAMDARSFFASDVSKLRFHQFGLAGGGPALIPKLYNGRNRSFWFFSYQGLRIREDQISSSGIPPAEAELRGDFSRVAGGIRDPLTQQPFPNGQIPQSRFDPVAARVLQQYSQPANRPNGSVVFQVSRPTDGNQYLGRFDQILSDKNRFNVRYFIDNNAGADQFPQGTTFPGYSPFVNSLRMQTATVEDTHTFTATLLNSLRVTYTRFNYLENNTVNLTLVELGGTDFTHAGGVATLPRLDITGRFLLSPGRDRQRLSDNLDFSESLSWSQSRHQWKFGADVQRNRFLYRDNNNTGGQFLFDGTQSRDSLADFILGRARSMQQASPLDTDQRYTVMGFYAQDAWKVNQRVTLSLGLRFEVFPAWKERYGKLTSLVPGAQSSRFPNAPAGLVFPGDGAYPYRDDRNNFSPRFGIAWDVFGNGRTAVRTSFGVFYEPLTAEMAGGVLAPQPFGLVVNRDVVQLSSPYLGVANPFPYTVDPANARFVTPVSIPKSYSPDVRIPYSMNYNLGVQQQLGGNYMAEISYVGNIGRKLPMLRELNIAQLTPNASTANTNQRRIYAPAYVSVGQLYTDANANYNSLQVQLQKRFSRGFTLSSSYTWAKAIDEGLGTAAMAQLSQQTYQDPLNRRGERGSSNVDMRHRWATSFLYELPLLRGRQWYSRLAGGWELGAIIIVSGGAPFSLASGRDNSLSGVQNDRPNVVGDWRLPDGRSRAERITRYFETSAFQPNALGTFGNMGRSVLYGPGSVGIDTSFTKNFHLHEAHRLQLRFDAFNLPNRPNFGDPNGTLTSPAFGRILTAGAGRILQVSAKYLF
ncbi:MAG: carboxypeptidase regulatory-like domain-containing protein [Bryobacteraceae bacterium]